jgi:hypothetical protein
MKFRLTPTTVTLQINSKPLYFVKDSYWSWAIRNLPDKASHFLIQVLGLSFQ